VNPVLPDEAVEFGAAAATAFAALGGVDAARRAEDDPTARAAEVAGALDALGTGDLDPRAGPDALAAAAALCEAAGRVALPYPVAAALLAGADGRPFALVPDGAARVDHGDLFAEWRVARLGAPAVLATPQGDRLGTRLGPFVTDLAERGPSPGPDDAGDAALHLILTACGLLGTADRALELAVEHVTGRVQFGKPIAAFQSVQFTLADTAVAVAGLRELAHFTLWRLADTPGAALADALALRLHALDVGRSTLRTAQQLHGAAGVCDEYDVSVLTRMAQPALRLPWGAERTAAELSAAVRRDGFVGLFEHGGAAG
jgi:Acyl-CoA dehydrogenase, C-terminal domain